MKVYAPFTEFAPGSWAGLATAFVLASLTWRPYDTPIDVVRVGPHSLWGLSEALYTPFTASVADVAQFGQYVLIVTWRDLVQPPPRNNPLPNTG